MSRKYNPHKALRKAHKAFLVARDKRDEKELEAEVAREKFEATREDVEVKIRDGKQAAAKFVVDSELENIFGGARLFIAKAAYKFYDTPMTAKSTDISSFLWGKVVCRAVTDQDTIGDDGEDTSSWRVRIFVDDCEMLDVRSSNATQSDAIETAEVTLNILKSWMNDDAGITSVTYVKLERDGDKAQLVLTPHKPE